MRLCQRVRDPPHYSESSFFLQRRSVRVFAFLWIVPQGLCTPLSNLWDSPSGNLFGKLRDLSAGGDMDKVDFISQGGNQSVSLV